MREYRVVEHPGVKADGGRVRWMRFATDWRAGFFE
jgi:hypothetical protein